MKRLALFCIFCLPLAAWAQKQFFLPTAGVSDEEKDRPMIEVYLPKEANGSAVVPSFTCMVTAKVHTN